MLIILWIQIIGKKWGAQFKLLQRSVLFRGHILNNLRTNLVLIQQYTVCTLFRELWMLMSG